MRQVLDQRFPVRRGVLSSAFPSISSSHQAQLFAAAKTKKANRPFGQFALSASVASYQAHNKKGEPARCSLTGLKAGAPTSSGRLAIFATAPRPRIRGKGVRDPEVLRVECGRSLDRGIARSTVKIEREEKRQRRLKEEAEGEPEEEEADRSS